MRPPFHYAGGKARLAKRLCPHLPKHLPIYVEPFFGAGGIFFHRSKAPTEYINDLNGDIVNFYDMLREHHEELERKCKYTPYARELYLRVRDEEWPPLDTLENRIDRAWRFWLLACQGRGAPNKKDHNGESVNYAGGWRPSLKGRTHSNTATAAANKVNRFQELHERLKGVTIDNRDAVKVIKRYDDKQAFLYCDPPYVQSTRFERLYKCEYTNEQHIELLETLKNYKGLVALSGYHNEIYDELLGDWRYIEIKEHVSMSHKNNKQNKKAIEVLWMNYDELFRRL